MSSDGVLDSAQDLTAIYRNRFDAKELRTKQVLWAVLCESFFQQYVPETGTVLDLGAGNCEFTNSIRAARRIAVDLNPETTNLAAAGVEVLLTSSADMSSVPDETVDTVFTSNFFEHLPSKELLLETLRESRRVLRPGGRLVVMMPNLRYVGQQYWDYLDHYLPLTHLSLVEALELTGFSQERVIPKFVPYTVRQARIPVSASLIKLYLRMPLIWRLVGKQMVVVSRKPG